MVQPCDVYDKENCCSQISSTASGSDYNFNDLRRKWSNYTKSHFCRPCNCKSHHGCDEKLSGIFGMAWTSNKSKCTCGKPTSFSIQYLNASPHFIQDKFDEVLDTFKTQYALPNQRPCDCNKSKHASLCNSTFSYDVNSKTCCQKCENCCRHHTPMKKLKCCKPICCRVCPSESKKNKKKPLFGTNTVCTCCICGENSPYICFCSKEIVVNKFKLCLLILLLILLYFAVAYYFQYWPFKPKCKRGYSFFTKTKYIKP